MLLPLRRIGSNCWTRKNGTRTLTAKRWSKSSIVVTSIVADFETPAMGTRISSRSPTRPRSCFASLWAPSEAARSTEMVLARTASVTNVRDDRLGLSRP
jgi:hypothetical protein